MRIPIRGAVWTAVLCLLTVTTSGAQAPAAQDTSAMGVAAPVAVELVGALDAADQYARSAQSDANVPASLGPTIEGAAVGVRATVADQSAHSALARIQEPNVGHSKALMIAGGAALVAGLLIGDDAGALLAVGGAVVGLYGLYLYVR